MSDFLFGLMIALSVGPVALMIANYGMRAGTGCSVPHACLPAASSGNSCSRSAAAQSGAS